MPKPQIHSVLDQILQDVYKAKNLEEAKEKVIPLLKDSGIKETDKQKMLYEIGNITNLVKLQFYITNASFKYNGLGINKPGQE